MKEAAGEKKQDSGPESTGEDLMDQIMSVHLAKMDEIAAKVPVGKAIGPEDIAALRDELKAYIAVTMASLSSMMASAVTAMAGPMLKDAMDKMCAEDPAEEDAERAQLQAIIDEGVSRMQALTARVTDMIAEDRKEDAAERKAILKALAELAKPRKRTGVVKLPSGEVTMTVTEMMQ